MDLNFMSFDLPALKFLPQALLKTLAAIRRFEILRDRFDQLIGLRIVPNLGDRTGTGEAFFQHAPQPARLRCRYRHAARHNPLHQQLSFFGRKCGLGRHGHLSSRSAVEGRDLRFAAKAIA